MSERLQLLLLFGGQSFEHEVSVTSAKSMLGALDNERYSVSIVGITKNGEWVFIEDPQPVFERGEVQINDGAPVLLDYCGSQRLVGKSETTVNQRVDVVFPLLHGPNGEDGSLQGLLELSGLAYVGSGIVGSAVGMDKEMMRRAFAACGLAQTDWRVIRWSDWSNDRKLALNVCVDQLGFPLFVKPCSLGSSVGINKVYNIIELESAIDVALGYDYKCMVEKSVENGREIECAILGNEAPEPSCLGEIIPGADFYNYETKYVDNKSQLVIPAVINAELSRSIQEQAVTAFRAVEAFGLSRVDFLLSTSNNEVLINEINTMPGFTPISMYPKLWEHSGISYSQLIDRLVKLALERFETTKHYKMSNKK